jgi:uncharacterized delta-60 repeat protein
MPASSSGDGIVGAEGLLEGSGATSRDWAYALAIQRDGKVVAAGRSIGPWSFALARYTSRGTLDPRFGRGGKVRTRFGLRRASEAHALAVQQDGRLVAAGQAWKSRFELALARYSARGTLDRRFGRGGKVESDVRGGAALARAVAIQPDGKIVVVGFALVRYSGRGELDRSFGRGGKVSSPLGPYGDRARPREPPATGADPIDQPTVVRGPRRETEFSHPRARLVSERDPNKETLQAHARCRVGLRHGV